MPGLRGAAGNARADAVQREIKPVAELGQRIAHVEIVVKRARNGCEKRSKCRPSVRKRARVRGWGAAPHIDQMPCVAEQPSAANPSPVRGDRLDVSVDREPRHERRKVDAGVNRKRQRIPESSVHFEKHRSAVPAYAELDHRYAMPAESGEDGETALAHSRIRDDTDSKRASRPGRPHVANAPMRKFRAQLSVPHDREVADARSLHELL